MELSGIVAVVRAEVLADVERVLRELGVTGISVSKTKGYGEYQNFFSKDWMTDAARLEIFTTNGRVEAIADAIVRTAHTGSPGDGIVVVYPVQKFFNIRLQSEAIPDAG